MGYGRSISSRATLVAANLSSSEMRKNRRPEIPVHMHAGEFLQALASAADESLGPWTDWFDTLRAREVARDEEISQQAKAPTELVNPLHLFQRIEEKMADDAVLVVDGGISLQPRPTSCARASLCPGSTPVCSEPSASAAALRSVPPWCAR